MALSETSYEILSDLLVLRLETFLVTSTEEAKELRMMRQCQKELEMLHNMGTSMASLPAPNAAPAETPTPTFVAEKPLAASKLPRRLQRLIQAEVKKTA